MAPDASADSIRTATDLADWDAAPEHDREPRYAGCGAVAPAAREMRIASAAKAFAEAAALSVGLRLDLTA